MAVHDFADPRVALPSQLVLDSSLLLALRKGDDNPHAAAAYQFIERLGREIGGRNTIAWLLMPVLQECYHITAYHLLPQDALILSETERIGVAAVATLNGDWRRIAEFDIYTALPRMRACNFGDHPSLPTSPVAKPRATWGEGG